jgi:hypothetical protein
MVSVETFLDYLYRLETEDKQERAEKQRLKDSLEKKGNFKAAEAVESGKIPKKDKRKGSPPAGKNPHNQPQKSSQRTGNGKYCTLCAAHGKEDRFIHSHNADDCHFRDEYEGKTCSRKSRGKLKRWFEMNISLPKRSRGESTRFLMEVLVAAVAAAAARSVVVPILPPPPMLPTPPVTLTDPPLSHLGTSLIR